MGPMAAGPTTQQRQGSTQHGPLLADANRPRLRYRTHICDLLNQRLPSAPLTRMYRVSPMTEVKVLVIVLVCYGVLLFAMLWQLWP
jgi:hypothetical protein